MAGWTGTRGRRWDSRSDFREGIGGYFFDSVFSEIDSLALYAGIHRRQFGHHRLLAKRFRCAISLAAHRDDRSSMGVRFVGFDMEERYETRGELPAGVETGELSNMKPMIAAALTGLAWGILGALIGGSIAGEWAPWTVLAGPPIGYVIHTISRWSHRRSAWWLIPWAIVSTYLVVALFGLALGSMDALRQVARDPRDIPNAWKHVAEGILGCLWGLTFLPILWNLFPLAAVNHLLIRWLVNCEEAHARHGGALNP